MHKLASSMGALSMLAFCIAAAPLAAQEKQPAQITVTGCSYEGPELCRYFVTNSGRVYRLVPGWGLPMPSPNVILTVTATVEPQGLGFCQGAKNMLVASVIVQTSNSCRAGPLRRK
jgi:hypothetical protein